jgi:hypothetical protein
VDAHTAAAIGATVADEETANVVTDLGRLSVRGKQKQQQQQLLQQQNLINA